MKKFMIATGVAILFQISSIAQIEKGRFVFNGYASGYVRMPLNDIPGTAQMTRARIVLSPNIGCMITDRTAVGFGFDYSYSHWKNENGNDFMITNDHGLEFRFNLTRFFQIKNKFWISLRSEVSHFQSIEFFKSNTSKIVNDRSNFNVSVAPTIHYFIQPNLALSASYGILRYSIIRLGTPTPTHQLYFSGRTSTTSFGLTYFFDQKGKKERMKKK